MTLLDRATSEPPADKSTTLEFELSSSYTELNRVVWCQTQPDVILDMSDVDSDCHTCPVKVWVIESDRREVNVTFNNGVVNLFTISNFAKKRDIHYDDETY